MNYNFLTLKTTIISIIGLNLASILPSQALIVGGNAVVGGFKAGDLNIQNPSTTDVSILTKSNLLTLSNNQVGTGKIEGTDVFGLIEKQNVLLANDLVVFGNYSFQDPNYLQQTAIRNTLIGGRRVSSDLIWVDPVGEGFLGGNGRRYAWEGTLKFKGRILGILPRNINVQPVASRTSNTNSIFGLSEVNYSIDQSLDNVFDMVSFQGNTLNFKLTAGDGTDHFRVITTPWTYVPKSIVSKSITPSSTENVPEPMTILGSMVAFCFGVVLKKHNQKA